MTNINVENTWMLIKGLIYIVIALIIGYFVMLFDEWLHRNKNRNSIEVNKIKESLNTSNTLENHEAETTIRN